jgi:type VI secretion system protein ImpG
VNLFELTAEPIPLTMTRGEYRVVPDVAHPLGYEVYSIDDVTGVEPSAGVNVKYRPFYSVNHFEGRGEQEAFWYATRKASTRENDRGTEIDLQLVNRNWSPTMPAVSTLVVDATCTNRNLPAVLMRAGDRLRMDLEMAAPVAAIRCVRTPTLPLRPPRRKGAHWRLMSHLTLNHLTIAEGEEGRLALQELLRLYDFSDAAASAQLADVNRLLVDGLVGLSSRRVVGRVDDPLASGFCRGTEIAINFDEEKYVGTGAFLFASVLERFFAMYSSINSFTQLVARSRDGKGLIKAWPPRAGVKPLV